MTMNAVETTVRWEELEDRLEDETKCQSSHHTTLCSTQVTHRITASCAGPFNACMNSARYHLAMAADETKRCAKCGLPCFECWKVVPI